MTSLPIPSRLVPPRCALRRMPSLVFFWNGFFILFAWLAVETIFDRDSSSGIGSKFHRPMKWDDMVFFCKFVHLFALLFCPSDCELWCTINWISEKSIVNTCQMSSLRVNFLAASLPRIPCYMVLCLFIGLSMSSTMTAPLLDHVVRDRECIQSYLVELSSGFAVNQALSASAVHKSLMPIKKTVRTLHFWNCFAQLE